MGRWFVAVLVWGFTFTALAEDAETFLQWEATGYSYEALLAEFDFNETFCKSDERAFAGCLQALNTLLRYPKTDALELTWNPEIEELKTQAFQKSAVPVLYNVFLQEQEEELLGWMALYQHKDKISFNQLFKDVVILSQTKIPPAEEAFAAASAYNQFLNVAIDPHAAIMPAASMSPKPQNYFGIGALIMLYEPGEEFPEINGSIAISPMRGSPAEAAGIKKGDLILAVNGESLLGQPTGHARELLLGPAGTQVEVTLHSVCENEVKTVVVTRGPVTYFPDWKKDSRFVSHSELTADPIKEICAEIDTQDSLDAEQNEQALYVPLTSFAESNSMSGLCSQFQELQQKDLANPNSRGMILDLRGNPGGRLEAVSCMLNTIIRDQGPMIGQVPVNRGQVALGAKVQISSRFSETHALSKPVQVGNQDSKTLFLPQLYTYNRDIIVLVDSASASASEIFAGIIQDMGRGWVIGDRTYGKGSVQTAMPYSNIALSPLATDELWRKETTAIYTLPSGRSPQHVGILPEFRFDNVGEVIIEDDAKRSGEAKRFGSISYKQDEVFELPRKSELPAVANCAQAANKPSSKFKEKASQDERYRRPFVANYQFQLALDVLHCSPERPDTLQ